MKKKTQKVLGGDGEIYKLVTRSYSYITYIRSAQGRLVAEIYATTVIHLSLLTTLRTHPSFGLEQGDDIRALSDRRQIRS